MKDPVKNLMSILLFETFSTPETISAYFSAQHNAGLAESPAWSTTATRQRLIYRYWFSNVFGHFLLIFCIPALIILLSAGVEASSVSLLSIFSAGLIIYQVLYLFHYRPYFESAFLPRLQTIKESYDHKESIQLERCRKSQLSNFALTLVFYVIDKSSNLNSLQCNEESARRIARLYGIDSGSVKKNLTLIIGKKVSISARKTTEIQNQFEEAYGYLEELNFKKGIEMLRKVEQKILHKAQNES